MSETKFTPGPWDVVMGPSGQLYIEGKGGVLISIVSFGDGIDDEANGDLIAAAPDMYEELECARDVFRFYQSHHEFKGGTEKAIRNKEIADRIDRLLAKARGDA
jgi:hypothetical protein